MMGWSLHYTEVNTNCGWTAFAAQKGHLDVTKYLISQGAEVNMGDNDGRATALHSCCSGWSS